MRGALKCPHLSRAPSPAGGDLSAHSGSTSRAPRELWLSRLPMEVCEQIAFRACRQAAGKVQNVVEYELEPICSESELEGLQNESALNLARVNPSMRRAVLTMLNHRLKLNVGFGHNEDVIRRRWVALFGEDVAELDFREAEDYSDRSFGTERDSDAKDVADVAPLVSPILDVPLPKLRVVDISDRPEHLAFLARASTVREVGVFCHGRLTGNDVFKALSKTRVETLRVFCNVEENSTRCPFKDGNAFGAEKNALVAYCPHLRSVDVSCIWCRHDVHPIWRALKALKTLHELTIRNSMCVRQDGTEWEAHIPDEAFELLARLTSVKLRTNRFSIELVARIGAVVTELDNGYEHGYSSQKICAVGKCERLRKLCLEVTDGSEHVLPETIRKLPSLTGLFLAWSGLFKRDQDEFHAACPGLLLITVKSAPQLTDLSLVGLRIELPEMEKILEHMGPRLRHFGTSVIGQDEAPLERMSALFQAAAIHNSELRTLELLCQGYVPGAVNDGSTEEQRVRMGLMALYMLQRLELGAPFLSTSSLYDSIQELLN